MNQLPNTSPRIEVADALRGFSVLAILLLHSIEHFNYYSFPEVSSPLLKFTDKAIWDSLFFAFGGKAYAIFALLFGLSFYIQDHNQQQKGRDFRLRFMWRLVLLLLIGTFNALFFTGEVLVLYALVGFALVPVVRLSNKHVFAIAIVLLLQPVEWFKVFHALLYPSADPVQNISSRYWDIIYPVLGSGTFWETLKTNFWAGQLASLTWAWENARFFQTPALFMLGMLAGRLGLFNPTEQNSRRWVIIMLGALLCFFPLTGLYNMLPSFIENKQLVHSLCVILKSLASFSFMLVLVCAITWLFTHTRLRAPLMKLSPYGRMSMTNYITQSMVGSLLFYHWGFNLHNKLCITYSLLVGICLFIVQYSFCVWWMKNHKQGVMEYWWKKATWVNIKKAD